MNYSRNTTLQISNVISGVGAANVIPGYLHLKMNFRYSPATEASTLIKQVEDLCRELKLNYEATWTNSADSYYNDSKFFTDVVSDAVSRIFETEHRKYQLLEELRTVVLLRNLVLKLWSLAL